MPGIGDRIRQIRDKRDMTQDRLASLVGISKGFLSDVENNKTNVSSQTLLKIADALGASVDYLLKGETRESSRLRKPVVIPPELSASAEQLKLSYAETLELLDAYNSIVARRSSRSFRSFSSDDWKRLHMAIKKVFG